MPYRIQVGTGTEAGGTPLDGGLRVLLERAVAETLRARGVADAEVSLTLLEDEAIAALNARYLGHDGPTDVISFALYDEGEPPVGDIYVGAEQAARQAAEHGVEGDEELARLAVHGTLHVLGLDHPEGGERLSSPMWAEQERILAGVLGA